MCIRDRAFTDAELADSLGEKELPLVDAHAVSITEISALRETLKAFIRPQLLGDRMDFKIGVAGHIVNATVLHSAATCPRRATCVTALLSHESTLNLRTITHC